MMSKRAPLLSPFAPAKAGTQFFSLFAKKLDSRLRGNERNLLRRLTNMQQVS